MFLVTLPLAVVALVMAVAFVPAHVNEATDPVDNLGGILSVVLVGALILGDQLRAGPEQGHAGRSASPSIAVAALVAFVIRQRRAREPALRPPRRRRGACSGWPRAPGSSCSAR